MNKKTIFITGAAAGIGKTTALLFARRGWYVGLYDIDDAGMRAVAAEIGAENCCIGRLDVRDEIEAKAAFAHFGKKTGGRLDVLFNNAGIIAAGPIDSISPKVHRRIIDINVWGVLNCTLHALPLLRATPGAHIINMGSASALYGHPTLTTYAATKMAVKSMTEGLSLGLRKDGIKVSDMMPIWVNTALAHRAVDQGGGVKEKEIRITPDDVARKVWKAAHRNKLHWLMGIDTRIYYILNKLVPGKLTHFLARWIMKAD